MAETKIAFCSICRLGRSSVRSTLWHVTVNVKHIRGSSCRGESMAITQARPCLGCQSPPRPVGWTCSGLISSPPERMCTLKWQAWANHDDEGGESFSLMGARRVQGNASGKQTHAEIHTKKKKVHCNLRDVMGKHYCERSYSSAGKQTLLLTFLLFLALRVWYYGMVQPSERYTFNLPRLLFRRLFTDVCISVKEACLSVRLTPAYSVCRPQATSCPEATSEWPMHLIYDDMCKQHICIYILYVHVCLTHTVYACSTYKSLYSASRRH